MTSVSSKTAMIYLYVQKGPLSVWYVLHTADFCFSFCEQSPLYLEQVSRVSVLTK